MAPLQMAVESHVWPVSALRLDADVRPKPDEIRDLAIVVGYPIDQVMREGGIQAQTVFDGARA